MPTKHPTKIFHAIANEAEFTKELLGTGATQIRNANYGSKGVYFLSFTSLATGLERIGKLCILLDHFVESRGSFPSEAQVKQLSHNLTRIYERTKSIVSRRGLSLRHQKDLEQPVFQAMIAVLTAFAVGDRYANIKVIAGETPSDPMARWFREVDMLILEKEVHRRRKERILADAAQAHAAFGDGALVWMPMETGEVVTSILAASQLTGIQLAVAPRRQLNVLRMIRYWVEVLTELGDLAMAVDGAGDIPFLAEIFGGFRNDDRYLKGRKTWTSL